MAVSDISAGFDQRAYVSAYGSTSIRARSSGNVSGTNLGEVRGSIPSSDFDRFKGTGNITFRGAVASGTPSVSTGGGSVTSRNMSVFGGIRITYNYSWVGQSQSDPILGGTSTPAVISDVPSGRWVTVQFPAAGLDLSSTTAGATITGMTLPAGTYEFFTIYSSNQLLGTYEPGSSVTFANGVTRCQLIGVNPTGAVSTFPVQLTFSSATVNLQVSRAAAVTERKVFYKDSGFQSNGGVVAAIDGSKVLLTPTSSPLPTTFANVSNYSRGINGVTVDVLGLAKSNLTTGDVLLRVIDGAESSATPPSSWREAPTPSSISVTPGTATTAARIRFEWPDGVIQNSWLQIIIRPTANTGLAGPAVYYFGHAMSETNGIAPYRITGADLSLVQGAIANDLVAIGDIRDINKDRRVTGADLSLLQGKISNAIVLNKIIIPPLGSPEEGAQIAPP